MTEMLKRTVCTQNFRLEEVLLTLSMVVFRIVISITMNINVIVSRFLLAFKTWDATVEIRIVYISFTVNLDVEPITIIIIISF